MPRALRVKVSLREVTPEVWRVVDVPLGTTLDQLHGLLQSAMGWRDCHLHAFDLDGVLHAPPDDEVAERDETGVAVKGLCRFVYLYDWGDGWEHDVEVLAEVEADLAPAVVDGARNCPPEDVGGFPGYEALIAAIDGKRYQDWPIEWLAHDPTHFDAAERTRVMVLTAPLGLSLVGEHAVVVPEPVRLLLDLLAGGVKLTPGGRLPRTVVRAVQERYPSWHHFGTPARVEDDLRSLCCLHDRLRSAGLLRLSKGVLSPTKAAGSDVEVVRRLRDSSFDSTYAGVLRRFVLHRLASVGSTPERDLVEAAERLVSPGWRGSDGRPPDTRTQVAWAGQELVGLGLIVEEGSWQSQTWTITEAGRALAV